VQPVGRHGAVRVRGEIDMAIARHACAAFDHDHRADAGDRHFPAGSAHQQHGMHTIIRRTEQRRISGRRTRNRTVSRRRDTKRRCIAQFPHKR